MNASVAKPPSPNNAIKFSVQDMITITARLAQVLAEEVDCLRDMKVSQIEKLQKEKIFLTNALEAYRKLLDKHPELKKTITPAQRSELEEVSGVFNSVLKENHQRLLVAREVNHRMVQAIRGCVVEQSGHKLYNQRGYSNVPGGRTLSVTLNRQI